MFNEIIEKLDDLREFCKRNFNEHDNFYKIECKLEKIIMELEMWDDRDAKDEEYE